MTFIMGPLRSLRLPLCVECGRMWLDPLERWRAFLTDGHPPHVAIYCPACASELDEY
jgi:hypothetical protein